MITRPLLITICFLHNIVPYYLYLPCVIFLEVFYQVDECIGDVFLLWSQLITEDKRVVKVVEELKQSGIKILKDKKWSIEERLKEKLNLCT